MSRYTQAIDGQWVELNWSNQKEICCSCNLVHVSEYKVVNKKLFAKFKVDNRSTAAYRRKNK